jgi:hypothetical protein
VGFKKDSTAMPSLPDYVFEWIGRAVSERTELVLAECRERVAELKAVVSDLRAHNAIEVAKGAELRSQIQTQCQEAIKSVTKSDDRDLSDKEFQRRIDCLLKDCEPVPETKTPVVNVSVPITMPKKGKEVTTVEHDKDGRIKRSVKEEVD